MNITTKFALNDDLVYIHDNEVVTTTVKRIVVTIKEQGEYKVQTLTIQYKLSNGDVVLDTANIYSSLEELAKAIMNKEI